jgi:Fe-S cluster biogenesis protein NfuA
MAFWKFFRRFVMCDQCGCGDVGMEKTFEDKVKEAIESIRPALQGHGGDIELVATEDDNTVKLRLQGACQGCPGAALTMKMGVERILREKVPELKEVITVG